MIRKMTNEEEKIKDMSGYPLWW